MPLHQDTMQCHARMLLKIALANIKVSLMCELHPNIQWARMRAAIFSKRAILAAICTTEIFLFFHSFQLQFFHRRSLCSTSVHPLCLENLHQLSAVHSRMQVTVDLEVGGQDFLTTWHLHSSSQLGLLSNITAATELSSPSHFFDNFL